MDQQLSGFINHWRKGQGGYHTALRVAVHDDL